MMTSKPHRRVVRHPDRSNDIAPITTMVSGGTGNGGDHLPNTGVPGGAFAAAGAGALLLGAAAVVWARRRSHAG